jgi:hypothetical protein
VHAGALRKLPLLLFLILWKWLNITAF